MEWMILPYRRYFDFAGRSRRKEYWSAYLLWFIVMMAFVIAVVAMVAGNWQALSTGSVSSLQSLGVGFWVLLALVVVFFLASVIPMIALQVRRLHDLGVSGWWYLAYLVAGPVLTQMPNVGSGLNSLLGFGWIVWMFFPGTPGPNKYGDDPKDPLNAAVFA